MPKYRIKKGKSPSIFTTSLWCPGCFLKKKWQWVLIFSGSRENQTWVSYIFGLLLLFIAYSIKGSLRWKWIWHNLFQEKNKSQLFSFFLSSGNSRGICPVGKVSGHESWVLQVLELALLHLPKLLPEDVPTAMIWPLLLQLSAEPLFLLPTQLHWLLQPNHADGAGKVIRPCAPPAPVPPWCPCMETSHVCEGACSCSHFLQRKACGAGWRSPDD